MTKSNWQPRRDIRALIELALDDLTVESWTPVALAKRIDELSPEDPPGYGTSAGAVTASLIRMWERDQMPTGWLFDRLSSPRHIRRGTAGEYAQLKAREATFNREPNVTEVATIEAIVDLESKLVISTEAPAIAHFKAAPKLRTVFPSWKIVKVIPRPGNQFEVAE